MSDNFVEIALKDPKVQAAIARTPLDNAEDELNRAFDQLVAMFDQYDSVITVAARVPRFSENEALMDAEDELRDEVIRAAYDVVRAHVRYQFHSDHPNPPYQPEEYDEGYFCPVCGFIDDETVANSEDYLEGGN